jgi:predicted Zn-dependent protease
VPISVLNGSALRDGDLRSIVSTLQEVYAQAVAVERAGLDLEQAYDSSRRQNNSTALLAQILDGSNDPSRKKVAIVDVDLFIPVLTFVFGEAQLGGSAAIVSTHRLSNQFYGLPANPQLLLLRLEKEVVHEVGHTLVHEAAVLQALVLDLDRRRAGRLHQHEEAPIARPRLLHERQHAVRTEVRVHSQRVAGERPDRACGPGRLPDGNADRGRPRRCRSRRARLA